MSDILFVSIGAILGANIRFKINHKLGNLNLYKGFSILIINTFASEDDCDMFIMVLKQQWPNYIEKLPESTLEIVKDTETPNRMLALWTFKEKSHQKILRMKQCHRRLNG